MLFRSIGVAFGILMLRLLYMQVIMGERYKLLSLNNSIRLVPTQPPRGLILDRDHQSMVSNIPTFTVSLFTGGKDMDRTVVTLSQLLHMEEEDVYTKIVHQTGWAYLPVRLKENVPREVIAAIEERREELPGVLVQTEPRRFYRYHDMAAHVLGYVSKINAGQLESLKSAGYTPWDVVGQLGVEKVYDAALRGESGGTEIEVDHQGRPQSKSLLNLHSREPRPGNNLVLTLDLDLQELSENLLREYAGSIVVTNPQNGEVLAMASQPAFDLNLFAEGISTADWEKFSNDERTPLNHRAVNGLYPPGSIFKIVTASAGLEEKVIDTKTVFDCNGIFYIKTWLYRCWYRLGHSW